MVVDGLLSVTNAVVAGFDCVTKILLSLWFFGKCLSSMARNLCLILVLTFLLNWGLYQSMLFH